MKRIISLIILFCFFITFSTDCFAYTTPHHLVNMGRDILNVISSPIKALFYKGPQNVKKMYKYEVCEREKPEKRGLLRYKLFAIISAPAVEIKTVIDGIVDSAAYSGKFCKELLSIPFSD